MVTHLMTDLIEEGDSTPICKRCGDTGWVIQGDTAVRCDCYSRLMGDRLVQEANIPERYSHCDLLDFKVSNNRSLAQAKTIALEFARSYPVSRDGLLFMGGCGVGKTHLAVGIIKNLAAKGVPSLFVDFRTLLEQIKETFSDAKSGISESDLLEPVLETDVVVLDDLGAERISDWVRDRLGFIINHRYNSKKTMIITTNFVDAPPKRSAVARAIETLQDRIGLRLRSRLYEMCRLVEIASDDYRKGQAEKQQSERPRRPKKSAD